MHASTTPLRLSRLRRNETIRKLISETQVSKERLIAPLFVSEKITEKKAISSMPGQFQLSLNDVAGFVDEHRQHGIHSFMLFGIPAEKDPRGDVALREDGIVQKAIRKIKEHQPDAYLIADLCFCEYTSHGHCGILHQQEIDHIQTAHQLAIQAQSLAEAGADCIAPSGMIDGMIAAIREGLDTSGHHQLPILSYSVKYASSFYGPFREAAEGAPGFGDRRSYQMDPANGNEALREAMLDLEEGADMLMVKPAMNYLDVIYRIKQQYPDVPLGAYQVSGEYSMIKAAAKAGLIDEQQAMIESLLAIHRAGADFIISYFALDLAKYLG